ncbi:MAG: Mfa1 fimbrilin C-terminal domain-containing protein [Muribaculaceae bacterium]|nr:Mfa1 fimbrilin C-terminal domain-containing protein [Muribaculaceae bacterium]
MKKIYGFLGAIALFSLASCSNDEPAGEKFRADADMYMTLHISQLTDNSRTPSESQGVEVGKDRENEITNGFVILADTDGKVLTTATFESDGLAGKAPNYIASFKMLRSDLAPLFASADSRDFNVFVVTNNNSEMTDKYGAYNTTPKYVQDIFTVATDDNENWEDKSYWKDNYFLMSNSEASTVTITKEDIQPGQHTTQATALNLGEVYVQRAMSRFDIDVTNAHTDFKVMSKDANEEADADGDPATPAQVVTLNIDGICLINEADNAYLFKTVGDAYNTEANPLALLFGKEFFTKNWVFSPKAKPSQKTFRSISVLFTSDGKPLFKEDGTRDGNVFDGITGKPRNFETFDYTLMSALRNGEDDNAFTVGGVQTPANDNVYKIWRYAMPHTIAAAEDAIPVTGELFSSENSQKIIAAQKHGISTGVIYRAKMTFDGMGAGPVYAYGNVIYGSYANLKAYAASKEDAPDNVTIKFNDAVVKALGNNATAPTETTTELNKELVKNGFSIYKPAADGNYYCYYTYWNRHNDNGDNNVMGGMEFAAVRNNVYKLSVNTILKLGHPADPNDDPDPEDPGTPDETDVFWGEVVCKILPWEVRLNGIDF